MVRHAPVSQKCRYALQAIFELALRHSDDPVKIQEIALAQGIPQRFLEVILAELKHGRFVESKRGSGGGYMLARSAHELSVGQVISFLQGDQGAAYEGKVDQTRCEGYYAFLRLWKEVRAAVSRIYDTTTFEDLVRQELKVRKAYVPNYVI